MEADKLTPLPSMISRLLRIAWDIADFAMRVLTVFGIVLLMGTDLPGDITVVLDEIVLHALPGEAEYAIWQAFASDPSRIVLPDERF